MKIKLILLLLIFGVALNKLVAQSSPNCKSSIDATNGSTNGLNSFCSGKNLLLFYGDSSGNKKLYQWSTGSYPKLKNIIGATSPRITINTGDTFYIRVIDTSNSSHWDTGYCFRIITVNPQPNATFNANPLVGCGRTDVQFTTVGNNASGSQYDWTFGDINNNQSSLANPAHTYIPSGTGAAANFLVTLIIKNANSTCFDTVKKTIQVSAGPDASFNISGPGVTAILNASNVKVGYKICSPVASADFTFDNSSTTNSTNTNYQITWGDGSPDTSFTTISTSIKHKYQVGLYTLSYKVTNPNCSNTVANKIFLGTNPAVGIGSPGNTDICTPATLKFPIDTAVANKNPPGTTYTVHFNDGSADTTFDQPPPSSVTHIFNNTSCGTFSTIGGANAFYAQITASNPCKTTDAYVTGITVTTKPETIISSNVDITCINVPTTITNSGNIQITPYSTSTCNSGNVVWDVQPTTGWTLAGGSNLGNDNGSNNAVDWTTGTAQLSITFSIAGIYTVRLKSGNTCQFDTATKTICVNPTPTAAFSFTKNSLCVGDTATAISNTSTPNCGTTLYQWSLLSYTPTANCILDPSPITYVKGSDTSANPQIQFNSPGVYDMQLSTLIKGTLCSATSTPQSITVVGKPNIKINPLADICQNQTITPTATSGCDVAIVAYLWSFQNGSPATSTSLSPSNIQLTNSGTDTIIFAATNSCGTIKDTATINVIATPTFNANPTTVTVCSGQNFSINLNSSTPNVQYSWTSVANASISGNTNQATAIATTNISNTLTTSSTINDTVKYNITVTGPSPSNCVGETKQILVIVQAGATPANAGIDSIFCNQTNVTLHANNAVVGVGVWKQVGGAAATIVDTTLSNTQVTGLTSGVYQFLWQIKSNAGGCSSTQDTVNITVRPQVTKANAGSDILKCDLGVNSNQQLNGNLDATRTYETGTWNFISSTNGATINNVNDANAIVTFTNAGVYTLTWTIKNDAQTTDLSCKTSVDTVVITVKEFPVAGTINGTNEICKNTNAGTLTLTGNTANANILWQSSTDNITYNTIAGQTTTSYNAGVLSVSTWYRIKTYQTNCNDTAVSTSFKIQVDEPSVGGNITPTLTEVCTNSGNVAMNLQGNTGNNINWIYNINNAGYNLFSPAVTSTNITVANNPFIQNATTQVKIIDVKAVVINGVCAADTSIVATIKVYPNTEIANAGIDQNLCHQPNTVLQATTPTSGSGTWLQLSGPNTASIASTSNPATTISNLIIGTYLFKWQLNGSTSNICPATFDTVIINNYDTIINKIKSTVDTTCANQTININSIATVVGGDGTYTYQWQQSVDAITWTNVATNGQQENYTTTAIASLYFRRIVYSSTCTDTSKKVYINVQPGLTNNSISASQNVCINITPSLLNGLQPNGGNGLYQYQWQHLVSGVWTNIASETNINYQPPILNSVSIDSFRRVVSSGFCNGDLSNVVVVDTKADSKAFYTFTNDKLCTPALIDTNNIKAQDFPNANGTYEWYANNVLIGTGINFPNYTIVNSGDTVYIKLKTISASGCKPDSFEHKFYTVKTPTVSFSKSITKGCGPLTVSFTNNSTPLNAPTYKWDFGNGQTSNLQTPNNVTFISDTSYNRHDTTYYITLTAYTQCDSIKFTDSVTVLPKPRALFQPDTTVGCSVFHFRAFNNSLGTHNTYTWNFDDSSALVIDTAQGYYYHDFKVTNTDTFNVKLKAVNTCGADSFTINIVVFPNTIVPKLILDGTTNYGCAPSNIRFINNTRGANKFTVNFGDGSLPYISTNNPDTIYHYYANGGNYTATLKAQNSCTDSTVALTITLYNKPAASFSTLANQYCKNDNIHFTNTSDTTLSFYWSFGDGITSTAVHPNYTYTSAGNYTVSLVAKSTNTSGAVCTDTATKNIIIHDIPSATFTTNAVLQNCQPYIFQGIAANVIGNIYNWKFYDASSIDTTKAGAVGFHTFNNIGTYQVRLIVFNSFGCSDTSFTNVKVIETPKALFTLSDSVVCVPGKFVNCINKTTYTGTDALNFEWYVDGVQQSTTTNFSYNFTANSSITTAVMYNVKLVVTNSFGCKDSIIKKVVIQPKAIASFQINTTQGCAPFSVQVNNSSLYANIFKWYVDGNLVSVTASPSPLLLSLPAKTYIIKLVADYILGCGADSTVLQVVTYPKPVADFQIPITASCNGTLNINCFDLSNVIGGTIQKWSWSFGDGKTDTIQNPSHTYNVAGAFSVSLWVKDDKNCVSDVVFKTVKNFGKPKANFTVGNVCLGSDVVPVNLSTGGFGSTTITSYLWNFGDGAFLTGNQPVHKYNAEGNYSITLTVTADSSCIADTITKPVIIYGKPTASFSFNNNCVHQTTQFINNSLFGFGQNSIGNSTWNFGDGLTSNVKDAQHIYAAASSFNVKLQVSGNRCPNLIDTTTKIITINQPRSNIVYPRIEGTRGTPIQLNAANDGVSYQWLPTTALNNALLQNPIANFAISSPNIVNYQIKITDSFGCVATDRQEIWLFVGSDIYLPTAFTPNGDNANDLFKPLYINIQKIQYFRVFDRWGKIVFETSDMSKSWDGTLSGKELPTDTYVWTIGGFTNDGTEIIRKGNVTLIRN